jgi:hypothetical protein
LLALIAAAAMAAGRGGIARVLLPLIQQHAQAQAINRSLIGNASERCFDVVLNTLDLFSPFWLKNLLSHE